MFLRDVVVVRHGAGTVGCPRATPLLDGASYAVRALLASGRWGLRIGSLPDYRAALPA